MNILVADDDYMTVEPAVEHLIMLGHEVEVVDSIVDAVERLADIKYDVVFLDVMIAPESVFTLAETAEGNYTGLRLLERLRSAEGLALNRETPVVFITNWRDQPQVDRVAAAHGAQVLRKPLSLKRVEERLP